MVWTEKILYVVVFLVATVLSAVAHYYLTDKLLLGMGRQATFVVSSGLMLIVLILGGLFEDRYLWRGKFDSYRGKWQQPGRVFRLRVAPPPISMGVIIGIGSFVLWS